MATTTTAAAAIAEETAGDRLLAVYGILNGTVNYILTRMESENLDFGAALAPASGTGEEFPRGRVHCHR
jgi:homoserine dehydrogenase